MKQELDHRDSSGPDSPLAVRTGPARDKGRGVFALRRFEPGAVVVVGRAVRTLQGRTRHSMQTDWDRHVLLNEPAVLINHSCGPNTAILDNNVGGYDFIALTAISPGDEITWDYAASEWESIAVPECACDGVHCRGASLGYRHLTPAQISRLREYTARYLTTVRPRDGATS